MHQPHVTDVVSSGIHDAKNDLFNALSRIDNLIAQGHHNAALNNELRTTHQLIERSAQRLSELLSTYRVLRHENPVTLLPIFVPDFLADVLARAQSTATETLSRSTPKNDNTPKFKLTLDFHEHWFLDRELIEDCLINALQNAVRFARAHVLLSAHVEDDFLVLRVEDDGLGYPATIPGVDDDDATHTGLFLARKIAALHQRHARKGHVIFDTSHELGGAQFALYLP